MSSSRRFVSPVPAKPPLACLVEGGEKELPQPIEPNSYLDCVGSHLPRGRAIGLSSVYYKADSWFLYDWYDLRYTSLPLFFSFGT